MGRLVITVLMMIVYGVILFRNGISLNEITLKFSILYIGCWFILMLIVPLWEKHTAIKFVFLTTMLLVSVISYDAYVTIPKKTQTLQKELALLLGGSPDFLQLGTLHNESIENVTFYGDPKAGNFAQFFDYIVEVKVKQQEDPYYFTCKGTGPYCAEFEQMDATSAKKSIPYYKAY